MPEIAIQAAWAEARKADALAKETLGRLHSGHRIVELDMDRIYENGGGIHCVTQQQPR